MSHRPEHVECRSWGHKWFWRPATPDDRPAPWGALIIHRCTTCTAERRSLLGWNGDVLSRSYGYPVGYQDSGDDAPTKSDYRRMFVSNAGIELPDKEDDDG